jgi:cellulose synthase/poly-beta-1,6-N-acetylglucosamine synthase-like glycosyltransferase
LIYSRINSVAIICTKDRQLELLNILQNLENQLEKFSKIIVIDSSENDSSISPVYRFSNLDYYKSKPGLTHQRNIGISKIPKNTDYCHFFDDDVILEDTYLLNFNIYVKSNSDIKIATGRQLELSSSNFFISLVRLLKLSGKMLNNGINTSPNFQNSVDETLLEWMPGCNMIIASELLGGNGVLFDEVNRSGYSMGEDVDISIKLSRYGQIFYLPKCVYKHNLSTNNRASEVKKYLEFLNHRLLLTRDFPEKFKRNTLEVSVRLELILFSLLYFFSRKSYFKSWREAIRIFVREIN